jgi:hypothetical protein
MKKVKILKLSNLTDDVVVVAIVENVVIVPL